MFPFSHDAAFVANALKSLDSAFSSKSTDLIEEGISALFNNVVKPRLRPVLSETFRDTDYSLSDEDIVELARANDSEDDPESFQDIVPRRFEHYWDALMKPIQRLQTAKSFAMLLDVTAKHLARVLEKRIWSHSGKISALGAIRMERDFSRIVEIVSRGKYSLRDTFSKVTQICMLVNMDDEEWDALVEDEKDGNEEMTWVLSPDDQLRARNMVRG
jgi:hypothetical protein